MGTTDSYCDVDLETLNDPLCDSDLVVVESANHFMNFVKRLLQLKNLVETRLPITPPRADGAFMQHMLGRE